ncbi:beta strand repeat-containing protein [Sphingomonas nostoxanthinifaciens]|uniref:beta strand repeat-containing protein n=1 Tax=Sphingomonas nostoxanthinifaciens TaxID=2872652 RepID=UPI001CC1F5AE|nr:pilus assembly protein TadG-related protein [Sphingomonas nostoxanthinifaciens]
MRWFLKLVRAERGSVLVLGALSLTSLLGMTGLAVEASNGYAVKVRDQRVSDMAALAAAVAYKSSSSLTIAQKVASDVVTASGLSASNATIAPDSTTSPTQITVSLTVAVPIRLAAAISSTASYNVTNSATASLSTGSPSASLACITALGSSGNTVSSDGGASILASGCAISTNGGVSSSNTSATVTAKQITASAINDASASWGGQGIITTPTAKNWTVKANGASDGILTGNTAIKNALCLVNKLTGTGDSDYSDSNTNCTTALVSPVTNKVNGGQSVTFSSSNPAPQIAAYWNSSTSTYTMPAGTYKYSSITVSGGVTVNFTGPVTLSAGSIDMSGNGMTIGDGAVTVEGTFGFNSGSTITIGNGSHSFGSLAVTGGRTLRMGTGDLNVTGALTESGGSFIYINTAAGNSIVIGNSGSTGIDVEGGSKLCFTSDCSTPTAAATTFSVNGTITTAGGSTLVLPIAPTHVINGDLTLNGSSILGSGLYVIKGGFTNNTGGTMTGNAVTFALGGTFTLSGGTSLDLAAPTGSSSYGITDVLVATKSTAATTIGGGSADKYSGLFYAPKSPMSLSGGSSISTNGSACLMVMVLSVSSTGSGTLNASNCSGVSTGSSSASSGTLALIR